MADVLQQAEEDRYLIRLRGKVSGPFSMSKLKSMRLRGQFSRAHEVSADGSTWAPATTLEQLFESRPMPGGSVVDRSRQTANSRDAESMQPTEVEKFLAEEQGPVPASSKRTDAPVWYYRIDDFQEGPVAESVLARLIQSNELASDDLVWKPGMPNWLFVYNVPELAALVGPPSVKSGKPQSTRRWKLFLASFLIVIVIGFIGIGVVLAMKPDLWKQLVSPRTPVDALQETHN